MKIMRTRWFKVAASVLVTAYLLSAVFGIPVVKRHVRADAEAHHQSRGISSEVDFLCTFPLLPGVVVCRYNLGSGELTQEGRLKVFLVAFGPPHVVFQRMLWIS